MKIGERVISGGHGFLAKETVLEPEAMEDDLNVMANLKLNEMWAHGNKGKPSAEDCAFSFRPRGRGDGVDMLEVRPGGRP